MIVRDIESVRERQRQRRQSGTEEDREKAYKEWMRS